MASGDSLYSWTAAGVELPDDTAPQLVAILTASTDEPDDVVPVLDFDPVTQEYASFAGILPAHYGGGGITVTVIWLSAVATGNVKWDVAFKSFTADEDDLNTKVYGSVQTATEATASVAGELQYTDITNTDGSQIDNLAVEEYFRLLVSRDSADVGDTMNSNDARLVGVYMKET